MTRFICGNNKYEIAGLKEDTISLPVSFENLPQEIKVRGYTFYFPSPFHVSLVYIGKIIEKYNITTQDFRDKVTEDFCNFTKENKIEVIEYKDEYKFVKRGHQKTIVQVCEVSNLNKFYDFINEKYGLNIKYPVTHVTLYNVDKGKPGIYLMDSDELKDFAVSIENPIGHV